MRVRMFRVLVLCLLIMSGAGLLACKARQAPSADLAVAGSAAAVASDSGYTADAGYAADVVAPEGGKLSGNELMFNEGPGGRAVTYVYGAYSEGSDELTGNKLTVAGGEIEDSAYGAYTEGWAKNNKVLVAGGRIARRVEGGHGRQGSKDNELIFAGGRVEGAYGGYSSDGPADNNRLVVRGGTITDDAQAGLSLRGSAVNNTLIVEGGVIEDQAYGGYGMEGPATGNTTIVSGGVIRGDAQGAVSSTHQATGNTLILRGSPQIGGSVYGAFAVAEYGDSPDDVTGNKILLEGFNGALGDLWNAEEVRIDKNSRLANRERDLNFYHCTSLKNDGVIALSEDTQAYLEVGKYSGQGRFELEPLAFITIKGGELNAPLRIRIVASESLRTTRSFEVALVELRGVRFGKGLSADNAVRLLNNKAGGLALRLRHAENGGDHSWILSGE